MSRDYLESRPYTGPILAEFLQHGTAESDARKAAERIAGANATAAELGLALHAIGWLNKSFSAEIRTAILDSFAAESESWAWYLALSPTAALDWTRDSIERTLRCANIFRESIAKLREPLGWNDREYLGRKAA